MKKIQRLWPVIFAVFFCCTLPALAQTDDGEAAVPSELIWPRLIETAEANIVIYQPQLEGVSENLLQSRFAASVQGKNQDNPSFGAVWVEARIAADRDERTVRLVAIETVRSRFPDATPEQEQWFADILRSEIPKWDIVLSMDQLVAGLEMEQDRLKTEQDLNDEPPEIIYVDKPAALVVVDGDPILAPIENTELMAVINTPFPMVFRKADKTYYLIGKDAWYKSADISGQWQEIFDPPSDVAALEREPSDDEDAESSFTAGIIVFGATEPTELLSLDGAPKFVPFPGNNLMYVENTDNDLVFEVDSSAYYLLLSGRWFKSGKLDGPWSYVHPDDLPACFTDIPAESVKGELRASVPGTEEALDAVLDAQIPETAAVKRSEAKLTVEYDGAPQFESIQGAGIDYAVNTATPVLLVNGQYYAVDNGIWFTAASAKGPWKVADSVPSEVQDIPPSSPVHNVKYVYVYESTPEIVYVGYTPGYVGCYIHHGIVVYGTGYYYRPWYRHYYYPRGCTYGFSVRYSSYYGWSFGYSLYHGPFSFHFGYAWGSPRWGGWWGPPMYRPPYYRPPHHRPPHHPPPRPPRPPATQLPTARPPVAKPPGGTKPSQLPYAQRPVTRPGSGDLYDRRPDKSAGDRARPATMDRRDNVQTGRPATRQNEIFTDREGNVYRKGQAGWEQRQNGKWTTPSQRPSGSTQRPSQLPSGSDQRPSQTPATRPSTGNTQRPGNERPSQGGQVRPSTPQQQNPRMNNRGSLDSQQLNRNRGNRRTNNFYQNRQQSSPNTRKTPQGNTRNRKR